MTTINEQQLINVLGGIDNFVHNVGLTYTKVLDMNKYLDFRASGKANPNPYYEQLEATIKASNIQSGFDYYEQLGRKMTKEGIVPLTEEEKATRKPIWYDMVSKALVKHKTKEEYYFRYQDHESSYLSIDYKFLGNPIEKVMFEQYLKDTSTDYSKYQKDLDNELRIKVLNVKNIQRIVINKQEYAITH
jgi:hypothetical protein